jgi:hypothetical protein
MMSLRRSYADLNAKTIRMSESRNEMSVASGKNSARSSKIGYTSNKLH